MSETTMKPIPEHASGRLVYIGTDELEDVQGAVATIGAVLHFAAENIELFREQTNAHHAQHYGGPDPLAPSVEAYRQAVRFAHDLASPGCEEPLP